MIDRLLASHLKSSPKSILLLGPRQTGKSTLINQLCPDLKINLARETEFLSLASNPFELEARIQAAKPKTVFIDEVQRIPSLLNTVQAILDEKEIEIQFLLTGSSARKLKRGQANLLPGRVIHFELGPLCTFEIGREDAHIQKMLSFGTLPGIWTAEDDAERAAVLKTYASTYVKEEIQAEALTKNLEGFSRFLNAMASRTTLSIDFTKIAVEAAINRASAIRYFEILEDTLLVSRVDAFSRSKTVRLVQHPRFFFFDNGVLNGLLDNFKVSSDRIGMLFENLFHSQLMATAKAMRRSIKISHFRTESGLEVDFIVETSGQVYALELKASQNISLFDTKGLKKFGEFHKADHVPIIVYLGHVKKAIDGVLVLPWNEALTQIFSS
jgi:uncharacterized protein